MALLVLSVLERMAVAYYATRAFLQAIQTVFFNSVDVIGLQNIPLEGPVIFVGNHCNQFADGIMLIMNARRKVCGWHVAWRVRGVWRGVWHGVWHGMCVVCGVGTYSPNPNPPPHRTPSPSPLSP